MSYDHEREVNQAAYEKLRDQIDKNYPKGRFVALGGGEIIADAESFEAMLSKLTELGWEPLKTMVVQAGDDTPEYLEILTSFEVAPDA